MSQSDGTVTKNYTYDAFGVEQGIDAVDANPWRYCGEYFDKETGNIYLRARYYNPSIGRFTQEDPAGDGLNWYTYCNNNPVMFVDPWGLYYIVQERKRDYDLLGEYTGVYRVVKQSYLTSWIKGGIGFIPGIGALLSPYVVDIRVAGDVVGGSSTIEYESEWYRTYVESGAEQQMSQVHIERFPVGEIINKTLETANNMGGLFHQLDISSQDEIIFNLMEYMDLPEIFTSPKLVRMQMQGLEALIKNHTTYFNERYLKGKTMFEIDLMLENMSETKNGKLLIHMHCIIKPLKAIRSRHIMR